MICEHSPQILHRKRPPLLCDLMCHIIPIYRLVAGRGPVKKGQNVPDVGKVVFEGDEVVPRNGLGLNISARSYSMGCGESVITGRRVGS
jgi:hypothetical protein